MFYLVKYLSKEAGELGASLAVMADARRHIKEWGSTARDAGEPARNAQHLMQRTLNKCDVEVASTVGASMLLGHTPDGFTDAFLYIDMWSTFYAAGGAKISNHSLSAHGAANEDSSPSNQTTPEINDDTSEFMGQAYLDNEDGADVSKDKPPESRTQLKVYHILGQAKDHPVALAVAHNYKHRGMELRFMSPMVYTLTIRIAPLEEMLGSDESKTATRSAGRQPSKYYCFAPTHSLFHHFVQVERSKMMCPMHAGERRARFPAPLKAGEDPSPSYMRQFDLAAAFFAANFCPWGSEDGEDGTKPPDLSSSAFRTWVGTQQKIADDVTENDGPRMYAANVLQELKIYMDGLTLDKFMLNACKDFRMRYQHRWTEDEKREHWTAHADPKSEAMQELEKLRDLQESRQFNAGRLTTRLNQEVFMDELQHQVDDAMGACEPESRQIAGRRVNLHCPTYTIEQIDAVASLVAHPDVSCLEHPSDPAVSRNGPHSSGSTPIIDLPMTFDHVSDAEYAALQAEWQANSVHDPTLLPPLNQEQRAAARGLLPALRQFKETRRSGVTLTSEEFGNLPEGMLILLHGPAGTGKSHMLKSIQQVMADESLGTCMFSAYTGVAVTMLPNPAATLCTLFSLPINAADVSHLNPPTLANTQRFERLVGDVENLALIVLDECSFINPTTLYYVNERMKQFCKSDLPFGGRVVLICGDMHQKQPIGAPSIFKSLVASELSDEVLKDLRVRPLKKCTSMAPRVRGTELLMQFQRFNLTEQMRAADDKTHAAHLRHLRDVNAKQPISDDILASLQPLTAEAVAREGEKLGFAPIGVLSHMERYALNLSQAKAFAKYHNRPLLWWRWELTGDHASSLSENEATLLYRLERQGLCGFYVHGARAYITANINTGRGVVNGCDATMDSLTVKPGDPSIATCLDDAARLAGRSVWEVEINQPLSINVVPQVSEDKKRALIASGGTLETLQETLGRRPDQCTCCATDRKDQYDCPGCKAEGAQVLICQHCESTHWMQHKLVIPVKSERSVAYKTTSVEATRRALPPSLGVRRLEVDLAFALTDFKFQGKTLEYIILSLGNRGGLPCWSLESFYVLFSRVRKGSNIYVLGVDGSNPKSNDHLRKLRHDVTLDLWHKGYTAAGEWNGDTVRAAADAKVESMIQGIKLTKKPKGIKFKQQKKEKTKRKRTNAPPLASKGIKFTMPATTAPPPPASDEKKKKKTKTKMPATTAPPPPASDEKKNKDTKRKRSNAPPPASKQRKILTAEEFAKMLREQHESVMQGHELPLDSTSAATQRYYSSRLMVRMRVVDFMDAEATSWFVAWAKCIGIEVVYSNEFLQLGYACGSIAGKAVPLLREAQRNREEGGDFMTQDVDIAASEQTTQEHYQWLYGRNVHGDIKYSADTFPQSTVERPTTTTESGLTTPYLEGQEISYLVKMNSSGDEFTSKDDKGTFTTSFDSDFAMDPEDPDFVSSLTLFGAQERVGNLIRTAEQDPDLTTEYDVFVANTDKTGNGQHWFTVALAITTAPSPGMLRRALSPDEQDRVELAWGGRDDSSVIVVCSLRSGAGSSTVNILGKHFGR